MRFNQKKSGLIIVFLILFISVAGISSVKSQNLILNPGCEDTLINSEIPHWTEIHGSNWTQRTANPDPFAGNSYFFSGVVAEAELQQDVDVQMQALARLKGHDLDILPEMVAVPAGIRPKLG